MVLFGLAGELIFGKVLSPAVLHCQAFVCVESLAFSSDSCPPGCAAWGSGVGGHKLIDCLHIIPTHKKKTCECNIKVKYLLAAVLCPWLWLEQQQRSRSHVFTIVTIATCSSLTNQSAVLLLARANAVATPTGSRRSSRIRPIKAQFMPRFDHSRDRLVVRTLRCGRNNPGSNPGLGNFFI